MDSIDIRLLMVFDAIYKTRSVTAAAEALDLAQPAVSVALAKLRHHFGNPLFVRTSNGMEPTPFSEGLVQPVREALDAVEKVLGHRGEFDPASSERSFRICMTDISQLVLLPRLWETLARNRARHPHRDRADEQRHRAPAGKRRGRPGGGLRAATRGRLPPADAVRAELRLHGGAGHPRIGDSLDLARFEAEDHAVISSSGAAPTILEREIARQGIKRRVALKIPSFLGAAFVIEHTDLLLTVPRRLGDVLQGRGAFRFLPVPFPLPEYEVKQHWHERYHHDEGNRWLRRLVSRLLSGAA
jgi:DNA-binding transcriptional LysR family regulator